MKWHGYYMPKDVITDLIRYCNINGIMTKKREGGDILLLEVLCFDEECGKINSIIDMIELEGKGSWHYI